MRVIYASGQTNTEVLITGKCKGRNSIMLLFRTLVNIVLQFNLFYYLFIYLFIFVSLTMTLTF